VRYRATGNLKEHFDNDAIDELFNLQNPKYNEWSSKLFDGVEFGKDSPGYPTALRIAQIPDNHIRTLVGIYGPESREKNDAN
jgi:hypothetical protein